MAAPLILARSFREAHAFATGELGLDVGYYRVVNSVGTIKAVRGVDLYLVPGWDKRPDRFTMKSALKYTRDRLNVIDVEKLRESQAEFDAAMPPTPADTSVHLVVGLGFVHAIVDLEGIQSSTDPDDVDCETCLQFLTGAQEGNDEPAADLPEPAEAEEATDEPAPVEEPEDEIVVAEDNRQTWVCDSCMKPATREQIADMADGEHVLCNTCVKPAEKPKAKRRTRCKDCGTLHFKDEPCVEAD